MKKNIIILLFGIFIGFISFFAYNVIASFTISASKVYMKNEDNGEKENVEDIIDNLYDTYLEKKGFYIDLGTGTSFDIKTIAPEIDYNKLTVGNFIVGIDHINSGEYRTNITSYSNWSSAYISGFNSVGKSYSNGVLTLSGGNFAASTTDYNGFRRSMSATSTLHAWLIVNGG